MEAAGSDWNPARRAPGCLRAEVAHAHRGKVMLAGRAPSWPAELLEHGCSGQLRAPGEIQQLRDLPRPPQTSDRGPQPDALAAPNARRCRTSLGSVASELLCVPGSATLVAPEAGVPGPTCSRNGPGEARCTKFGALRRPGPVSRPSGPLDRARPGPDQPPGCSDRRRRRVHRRRVHRAGGPPSPVPSSSSART